MNTEEKLKKAIELLDGCYDIIEISSEQYPAQKFWKKEWLKDTKELIDGYVEERNRPKQEKPPLGLVPEKIHKEHRIKDILDACSRYISCGKQIPQEWTNELNDLNYNL